MARRPEFSILLATLGESLSRSLCRIIESEDGLCLAGHAKGLAEIIQTVDFSRPNMVLLDIEYVRDHGWSLLDRIRQHSPDAIVLLVGRVRDVDEAEQMIRHGAGGIVGRSIGMRGIAKVVDKVRSGEIWLSRQWLSRILRRQHAAKPATPPTDLHEGMEDLSQRESVVVEHLCRGLSNKQIAKDLEISENTVRAHVSNIFKKLHIRRRIDLIVR